MTLTAQAGGTDRSRRPSFADLSVNIKVIAAVGVAALVALVVGVMGLSSLSGASNSAQLIYTSNVSSIKAVGLIKYWVTQTNVDASKGVDLGGAQGGVGAT